MSDYTSAQGFELGWDDEIQNDSPEYITLPEGEYDFTVTAFERGRFQPGPSSKLPPCNMAALTLELRTPDGLTVQVKDKLYLHSSTEGFLCEFFTAIGQRRHGERVRMNWNAVTGARGRARVGVRTYQKDGETRTINEIKKYLEPRGELGVRNEELGITAAAGTAGRDNTAVLPESNIAVLSERQRDVVRGSQTGMAGFQFNPGHFSAGTF